jgi:hypothetical protein
MNVGRSDREELLHLCGHEDVSALSGVLRRLFVVTE